MNWSPAEFWSWFRRREGPVGQLRLNERHADCDWHKDINEADHRTSDYFRSDSSMVVRRGQAVKFTARLNRNFDESLDEIKLDLQFGISPNFRDGSHILVEKEAEGSEGWHLTYDRISGTHVTCSLHIPANAMIGKYKTAIYLKSGDDHILDEEPDLLIICNPWCEKDQTYMANEEERQEYVLNDTGYIWRGTKDHSTPCHWNFGQFEAQIIDVGLELLTKDSRMTGKNISKLSDAVWISRILSAVANSSDENGILTGRWDGQYDDGKSPVSWNGSVEIIQKYAQTNTPVKYGQCWVFSGLLTSLLRAVGVPARSVTNFASAHDTDNTCTIDNFIHENNEKIAELCDDSVWNFHVWNEVWLKGQNHWDEKFDGWAAVDATPQETSFGRYQLGPAPIKAIKEGITHVGYDCSFVFGEVNADRCTWVCEKISEDGKTFYPIKEMSARYERSVGFNISTKAVGSRDRQVLTNDYKYPENSSEERQAWKNAYGNSSRPDYFKKFLEVEKNQLKVTTSSRIPNPENGKDVTINISVENLSEDDKTLMISSSMWSCYYTGSKKTNIYNYSQDDQFLAAGDSRIFSFTVAFEDYQKYFADEQMSMRVDTIVKVVETGKAFSDIFEFQFFNASSSVEINFASEEGKVGEPLEVEISFTNPLPMTLTDLSLTLEGPGLVAPSTHQLSGEIPANTIASVKTTLIPSRAGTKFLMVDIDTKQQKDFKAEKSILIHP